MTRALDPNYPIYGEGSVLLAGELAEQFVAAFGRPWKAHEGDPEGSVRVHVTWTPTDLPVGALVRVQCTNHQGMVLPAEPSKSYPPAAPRTIIAWGATATMNWILNDHRWNAGEFRPSFFGGAVEPIE